MIRFRTAPGLLPLLAVLALAAAPTTQAQDDAAEPMTGAMTVEQGRQIAIEYSVALADGTQIHSNVGEDPFVYEQGGTGTFPALQDALTGMKVDQSRTVTLAPEQAYGPVRPDAFQEVEKTMIPAESLNAGTILIAQDPAGNRRPVRVHEVKESTVVLDFNHPLAGQALTFDVRVVDIK